jgi:hypothetical protein
VSVQSVAVPTCGPEPHRRIPCKTAKVEAFVDKIIGKQLLGTTFGSNSTVLCCSICGTSKYPTYLMFGLSSSNYGLHKRIF